MYETAVSGEAPTSELIFCCKKEASRFHLWMPIKRYYTNPADSVLHEGFSLIEKMINIVSIIIINTKMNKKLSRLTEGKQL